MAISPNFSNYFKIFLKTMQGLPNDIDFIGGYKSYHDFLNKLKKMESGLTEESLANKTIEEVVGEFIYKFEEEYKQEIEQENKKIEENTKEQKQPKPKQTIDPKAVNNVLKHLGEAIISIEKAELSSKQAVEQEEKQKIIPGNVVSRSLRRIGISFKKLTLNKSIKKQGDTNVPKSNTVFSSYAQKAKEIVPKLYLETNIDTLKKDPSKTKMLQKNLIALFNLDPKSAISLLPDTSPKAIAGFLRSPAVDGVSLDKKQVGDYLGSLQFPLEADKIKRKKDKENNIPDKITEEERAKRDLKEKTSEAIIDNYMAGFNFEKQNLSESLRQFLGEFHIPGETEKIERLLEKFSQRFFTQNDNNVASGFENQDAANTVAFAILMLNTDAHKPGVIAKMTFDQFQNNLRGMNEIDPKLRGTEKGKSFSTNLLKKIYLDITKNEIKLTGEAEPAPRTSISRKT